MIFAILRFTVGLFIVGGFILYAANRKVDAVTRRQRWIKYVVYVMIVHTILGSAIAGSYYFFCVALMIVIIGFFELSRVCLSRGYAPISLLFFATYLVLAFGLLAFAYRSSAETIIFVYLTVAVFDGFSQVTGQLLGKHPLAPQISPNKTLEGTCGGLLAAISAALILRSLPACSPTQAGLMGLGLSLAGLGGDLAASYVKRRYRVKDFGAMLPGHGGVLDRFDSFFAAATIFWLYSALVT